MHGSHIKSGCHLIVSYGCALFSCFALRPCGSWLSLCLFCVVVAMQMPPLYPTLMCMVASGGSQCLPRLDVQPVWSQRPRQQNRVSCLRPSQAPPPPRSLPHRFSYKRCTVSELEAPPPRKKQSRAKGHRPASAPLLRTRLGQDNARRGWQASREPCRTARTQTLKPKRRRLRRRRPQQARGRHPQ